MSGIARGYASERQCMQVINSRFAANSASRGGAIYAEGASVTVMNSQFSGNTARTTGGALYCASQSQLTIMNSTFTANMAGAEPSGS